MSKRQTTYKKIPKWGDIDQLVQVKGFLPKPEELVTRPKLKKVTFSLDEDSINFFKEKAKELNTSYQCIKGHNDIL